MISFSRAGGRLGASKPNQPPPKSNNQPNRILGAPLYFEFRPQDQRGFSHQFGEWKFID